MPDFNFTPWTEPTVAEAADAATPLGNAGPRRAIVYLHGIFSDHGNAFGTMHARLVAAPELAGVSHYICDYDYFDSLWTNGERLAKALSETFHADDEVVLVTHSMGGLVARCAILATRLECVRLLFLLGTPNGGAIRVSQVSLLAQLLHGTGPIAAAVFPRKAGIMQLAHAADLFHQYRALWGNAAHVDYVSIPGRYYHKDRSAWSRTDGITGVTLTLTSLLGEGRWLHLSRAHDGIVEEASNNLTALDRMTEKWDSYACPRDAGTHTYAHIRIPECDEVSHHRVQHNPAIIDLVRTIIAARLGLISGKPLSLGCLARDPFTLRTPVEIQLTR
ncbi:pimeloyl-ACP methyl ester carboxylesterase [Azospirillum lipoferum]|nr:MULTISPECIES: alpha/beta hydrolase [Azospirillum]MCP1613532.1 pimeloyl-ACP methyl ester carboxylesterase [Azospirillum lipoferum]MDW5532301.1 alpha/beta hydrolase [Azospirillum sp. NL1]